MEHRRSLAFILGGVALNIAKLGSIMLLRRKTMRRWWVRPINCSRDQHGYFNNLFQEMKTTDHEEFNRFTRMWPEHFQFVLNLVEPHLRKRSNRRPLDPELRLALTLSYLAHGDSIKSKAWQFRVGRSTAYEIIPETCRVISEVLQATYLPAMNRQRWQDVARGYLDKWQFPNCLGALDGKHIRMQCPRNSRSQYYNYKKFFSLVLMSTCDAQCRFTWFDIGQYGIYAHNPLLTQSNIHKLSTVVSGSISDGGVWDHSDLAAALNADKVDLPPPQQLPQSNKITPFAFVADAAFPLKPFMMKPYPQRNAGLPERVFNYRLSRARRTIENSFGILASRWKILQTGFSFSPDKVTVITRALVCLHNFIMINEERLPLEKRAYENSSWTRQSKTNHRDTEQPHCDLNASEQRDILRDYFLSSPGESLTPWQYTVVNRGFSINYPENHSH